MMDGMGPNNGQHMQSNGQMPPQGPGPQQPNGNASEQAPNGETQAQ